MPASATLNEIRRDVEQFYFDYAANLDRRETRRWIEFFTEDGIYGLTTYGNATGQGMYLIYEQGRDAITRRAAVVSGYLTAQRNKTLHTISNVRIVEVDGASLRTHAYFTMFRTGRDKTSQLHACGEFHDSIEIADGKMRFSTHRVVLDAETLPSNMADLF